MNSHDPDWNLYRTFVAVVREGSLSGAARTLGITQPSVARHIDALEAALGTTLFVRTQRGLSPTDRALALRPHAEQLEAIAAAMRRTSGQPDEAAGTVRLTVSEVIAVEYLPPILARLRQDHPRLAVEVVVSDVVDDLLGRAADVAVRAAPPTQQALVSRRIGAITLGFHAHRDYLDRRGTPIAAADLASHDIIGFDRRTSAMRAVQQRVPELDEQAFAFRTDSTVAQLAMIRAGTGIGVTHVKVAKRDADLVRVMPGLLSLTLPVWIVMHEDLRTSAGCRVLFDAVASGLEPLLKDVRDECKVVSPRLDVGRSS